jgi:hypothetical protein
LTSIVFRHCFSISISRESTTPTMPAKQNRCAMLPRCLTTVSTASLTPSSSVTSTAMLKTRVFGKSLASERISDCEDRMVDSRSQRQQPEAPCSRRARAQDSPRVPAPPVTAQCISLCSRFCILKFHCHTNDIAFHGESRHCSTFGIQVVWQGRWRTGKRCRRAIGKRHKRYLA